MPSLQQHKNKHLSKVLHKHSLKNKWGHKTFESTPKTERRNTNLILYHIRAKSLHQEESCWLHEELPILLWWSCMPHLGVGVPSRTLAVGDVDDRKFYDPETPEDRVCDVNTTRVVYSFVLCSYEFWYFS